jgi:colicin import membrane protein
MKRGQNQNRAYRPFVPNDRQSRIVFWGVLISMISHGIVLGALTLMPDLTPSRKIPYSVVNVRLVSAPAPKAAVQTGKAPQRPATAAKAAPEPTAGKKTVAAKPSKKEPKKVVPIPKPDVKAEKEPIRSLKQKTFKSSKVLENTLTKLKKEVDRSQPPSLEKALERLKEQVKETEPVPSVESSQAPGATGGVSAATTPSEQEIRDRIQIYNAEIAYQIRKNWVFSEQLAGNAKDLETALGITILPDGRIDKIWFDAKSGNRYLDESAYRALMKSSPLPPLPEGVFDESYTVGLRFGPKGLKP